MPKRIQRKRTKGWRKPEDAVYVGRPSKWGNPYREGQEIEWLPFFLLQEAGIIEIGHGAELPSPAAVLTLQQAVDLYRAYIKGCIKKNDYYYVIERLRGKDLMCWCSLDQPCHADVLLEIANKEIRMGELRELGPEGDTRLMWDADKKDEVDAAKDTFDKLKGKGYFAYKVKKKGGQGKMIKEFDPQAEKIIMALPMKGG